MIDRSPNAAPAYLLNGERVAPDLFYAVACDPQRSVVVEACAGAGKTWMLVSRIVRALVEGAEPDQVLAITFTRKAAGEMRARLHEWLRDAALMSPEQRLAFLAARGLSATQAKSHADALGALYARSLQTGEAVHISTIHGWFSRLVAAMPLDVLAELGLPPKWQLVDDPDALWPALWGQWLRAVEGQSDSPVRAAFEHVLAQVGQHNLGAWLQAALANRLELHLADQDSTLWQSVPPAAEWMPAFEGLDEPVDALARPSVRSQFEQLGRELGQDRGKKAQDAAQAVVSALLLGGLPEQADALIAALFTAKGEPRKQLGGAPTLAWAHDWLRDLRTARQQQAACNMHKAMVLLSRALFDQYARLKRSRGLADMVDVELAAARLLQDPVLSGWVQQRLDARWRHVLMDEFQDTSPLQWSALHGWLAAYAGAGGGGSGREPIRLFVVGDPKQSIYRFRRADPRVFQAAQAFVQDGLGGDLLACDHTRRNAVAVIDTINRTLAPVADAGLFSGFRPHTTDSKHPGQLRVLPDVLRPAKAAPESTAGALAPSASPWRDSLREPRHEPTEVLKQQEARHVAQAIAQRLAEGACQPEDIFVLGRKRAVLALVSQALAELDIAHAAPDSTCLVDTPEARDLLAVMQCVVTTGQDLALAQALKSPAFGASDALLMAVARGVKAARALGQPLDWWDALMALDPAASHGTSPPLPLEDHAALREAQRLLPTWRQAARTLPPHDLLQQIVDDAGWRQRLSTHLSPPRLRQALLHLDALLVQSLALNAGRHATPYRWLRELRQLREPLPALANPQAVQLLTIHGAKGLEARVVFLIDTDTPPPRRDHHALAIDWPQGADRPQRCAFVASEAAPAPSLVDFLAQEQRAQQIEEHNALYVALSRAREQLVISRTEPHGTRSASSWWNLLWQGQGPDDALRWTPATAPAQAASSHQGLPVPAAQFNRLPVLPTLPPRPVTSAVPSVGWGARAEVLMPPGDMAPSAEAEDAPAAQWGQALHRLLEWVTPRPAAERTPELLARLAAQAITTTHTSLGAKPGLGQAQALAHMAQRILTHPGAAAWLDPAQVRWAGNEVALWHQGQLLRIDRLVAVDGDQGWHWWVLDYKTQHQPQLLAAYRSQLARYVAAVQALEPGSPVSGAFIAGDGSVIPL